MKRLAIGYMLFVGLISGQSNAAPGSLDLSFGGTGKVTIPYPGVNSEVSAIAAYPDGRIIVAGTVNGNFTVMRRNQNGSADTTFNGTGSTGVSLGGAGSSCSSMAIGPNAQIILAGSGTGGTNFGIAGFDEDGFNTFKTVTPGVESGAAVAIQPNGKIVVVGSGGSSFTVARYETGGELDPTFDSDGKVGFALDLGSNAYGVAVQPDGKIVLVGNIRPPQGTTDFLVMRLNSNGSLDTSFGGTGYVATPVGTTADYARDVVILPDGKIAVAGWISVPEPDAGNYAVVRYNSNGTLDTTFNGTGKSILNLAQWDIATKAAVQRDGKILVAGNSGFVRFNADGSPDLEFGAGGKVSTPDWNVNGIATQPDGQIVIAAIDGTSFIVARYHAGIPVGLSVEQPPGTALTSGSTQAVDFGTVIPGQSAALTFTFRNHGTSDNLTGLAVTKTAAGTPSDFTISALEATNMAPGASTTLTVTFAPSVAGTRTATLAVTSNDPDNNPFTINLTGWGATGSEVWRKAHFGAFSNDGPGADLSDPDRDGIVNLLEYATSSDPQGVTPSIGQLMKNGSNLEFTYTRIKAALNEVGYGLESSAAMSGIWIKTGMTETILSDDGIMQQVKVTTSAGAFGKRFVRLRITRL